MVFFEKLPPSQSLVKYGKKPGIIKNNSQIVLLLHKAA